MTAKITSEERQIVKLIEQVPVSDEEKQGWSERVYNEGFSEELGEEIRQKLTHLQTQENNLTAARLNIKMAGLVQRWRLARQTHNFGKR
ncbi:MAG: hypothetical protein GYA59_14950 [Chloroflexi bacterium]|nr:hypothetical protein [Chloroflexota bacterium]